MNNFLRKLEACQHDPRSSALCIVVKSSGSTPGKLGAKMIVYSDGSIDGTVGGGSIEKKVIENALEVIRTKTAGFFDYNLKTDLAMNCGGAASIYIEPLQKPSKLYIFGAGHIGKALAGYAPDMGFETQLIDFRKDLLEMGGNIRYTTICKPYLEAVNDIVFDEYSYCVIVTPNHEMDEDVLAAIGSKPAGYIGMIGSKIKIEALKKRFIKEGRLSEDDINRIDMPIGIKFNALAPAELAISILAKMIDVKNNKAGGKFAHLI